MHFVSLCPYAEEQQKSINKRASFSLFYCRVALNALRPANGKELFPQAAPGGPWRSPDSALQINTLVSRSCCLKMLQNPMNCVNPARNFSSGNTHASQQLCSSDVKALLESRMGCFLWSLSWFGYDERDDAGETVFLRLAEAAISDLRASLQSQSIMSFRDHSPQMNSSQK